MWLAFVSTDKKTNRLSMGSMQFPKLKPMKADREVLDERRQRAYRDFLIENFGEDDYYNCSIPVCEVVAEWMANASAGDTLYLPQSDDIDRQILFFLSEAKPREFGVTRTTVTQFKITSEEDDSDDEDESEEEEDEDDDDDEDEDEKPRSRRNRHGRH